MCVDLSLLHNNSTSPNLLLRSILLYLQCTYQTALTDRLATAVRVVQFGATNWEPSFFSGHVAIKLSVGVAKMLVILIPQLIAFPVI